MMRKRASGAPLFAAATLALLLQAGVAAADCNLSAAAKAVKDTSAAADAGDAGSLDEMQAALDGWDQRAEALREQGGVEMRQDENVEAFFEESRQALAAMRSGKAARAGEGGDSLVSEEDCESAADAEAADLAPAPRRVGGSEADRAPMSATQASGRVSAGGGGGASGGSMRLSLSALDIATVVGGGSLLLGLLMLMMRRNQHRATRYLCHLPVKVDTGALKLETWLVELSRTGARLAIDAPVAVDQEVVIFLEGRAIPAIVIWSNAHFMGVKLFTPLAKGEAAKLASRSEKRLD